MKYACNVGSTIEQLDGTHWMLLKGTLKYFILKKYVVDGDGCGKHAHVHIGLHVTIGLLVYIHFPNTD